VGGFDRVALVLTDIAQAPSARAEEWSLAPEVEIDVASGAASAELADATGSLMGPAAIAEQGLQVGEVVGTFHAVPPEIELEG